MKSESRRILNKSGMTFNAVDRLRGRWEDQKQGSNRH
jgi:hypothetical protein